VVVAFDSSAVAGAVFAPGFSPSRVRAFARAPLAAGALVPSPVEPSLVRPEEVGEALALVFRELQPGRSPTTVLLPDGVARIALLVPPRRTDARDYARFRLTAELPYPADEALVDVLNVGRRVVLGAALRKAVVEGYEAAVAGAGFAQSRLDVAPLAAVAELMRRPPSEPTVVVILGDVALSLAGFVGGALKAFRTKRRDAGPDEAERLVDEAERTAALAGADGPVRLKVAGAGARTLVRDLVATGHAAALGWSEPEGTGPEPPELAWLGPAPV
jgi:hypothetical protein